MIKIPEFRIFGEGETPEELQLAPGPQLRSWDDVERSEKAIILQALTNRCGFSSKKGELLDAVVYLNYHYLHLLPGPKVHDLKPTNNFHYSEEDQYHWAALADLEAIVLDGKGALVLALLSRIAYKKIVRSHYLDAQRAKSDDQISQYLNYAFRDTDRFIATVNNIFSKFRINKSLTREGFIPVQDNVLTASIYHPVMEVLSAPIWQAVSADLQSSFDHFDQENYSETITRCHSALQRFLQVLLGRTEGKNGRGELGKLWADAEELGFLPKGGITRQLRGYFAEERATNSSAKPAVKVTTAQDALLMLNVSMSFVQFCLTARKSE